MEANDKNLQMLCALLEQTNGDDSKKVKAAHDQLKAVEAKAGFPICVLKIISNDKVSGTARLAGSIFFKNFIKRHWVVEEGDVDCISSSDRELIKKHIVDLMLNSPKLILSQLSEALHMISKADFPKKWESLLPDLISKLKTTDFRVIIGVFETLNSIFNRYRFEQESDPLWSEIKFVTSQLDEPFLNIVAATYQLLANASKSDSSSSSSSSSSASTSSSSSSSSAVPMIVTALIQMLKAYHSLYFQSLTDYAADKLKDWFGLFLKLLQYKNAALDPKDTSQPGLVEQMHSAIVEILNLHIVKYEEDLIEQQLVSPFVQEVWSRLMQLNEQGRFDDLATTSIKFLTHVVTQESNKSFFANENALKVVCEKVIIPQLKLRVSDVEQFQTDGVEYIRRDMEGSDVDTRRRTTVDFVRGLCKFFEAEVTSILKNYVSALLKEYAAKPKTHWVSKDAALYIVLALTIKGETASRGVTITNPYVDIISFFKTEVLPELQSTKTTELPILKADCLKFLASFRSQLPKDAYPILLPIVLKFLQHEDFVVHTYASVAIEKLLSVQDKGTPRFTKDSLKPFIKELLTKLFAVLEKDESKENEYVMGAILRVCTVARETIAPFVEDIIKTVAKHISAVSKNPKNPYFNHCLFETLASLIHHICTAQPSAVSSFEKVLFPIFEQILNTETCAEFFAYVFQLMAQLLEFQTEISKKYQTIFQPMLAPVLWENTGNIPALTRLLLAYIQKGQTMLVGKPLEGVLGIFQRFNSSKKFDMYGFELLRGVIQYLPISNIGKYLPELLRQMFTRLSNKQQRTPRYINEVLAFFCLFSCLHGFSLLAEASDSVQKGALASGLLEKILFPNIPTVPADDKKIVICGLISMLTKSPLFIDDKYVKLWPSVLNGLMALLEPQQTAASSTSLTTVSLSSKAAHKKAAVQKQIAAQVTQTNVTQEEDFMETVKQGASSAFCKLANAARTPVDPLASIRVPKEYAALQLALFSKTQGQKLNQIASLLTDEQKKFIMTYISQGQQVSSSSSSSSSSSFKS
eukprot:TRINITY_DN1039_c1_g1_i1.p1 TRINITY_DN1039_c1_g1~~TRINITY_DN1039_c1_g1_i1.p1  ORF type:complete len:1035 (-),score=332.19 TRINITY_DN1039_c1_g1_i1:1418-4522(-)